MVLFFALNSLSEKNKLPTLCTVVVRKVTSVTLYLCWYCNFAEDVIFFVVISSVLFSSRGIVVHRICLSSIHTVSDRATKRLTLNIERA